MEPTSKNVKTFLHIHQQLLYLAYTDNVQGFSNDALTIYCAMDSSTFISKSIKRNILRGKCQNMFTYTSTTFILDLHRQCARLL